MSKYEDMMATCEGFGDDFEDDLCDDLVASDDAGVGFSCEIKRNRNRKNDILDDKYCQSDDEGGGYI